MKKTSKGPQTKRHKICVARIAGDLANEQNAEKKSALEKDLAYLSNMNTPTFIALFDSGFKTAQFEHKRSLAICLKFYTKEIEKEEQIKRTLSSVLVKTAKCAHCGQEHSGLKVTYDIYVKPNGIENYIPFTICPVTGLRLSVVLKSPKNKMVLTNLRDILYHTDFEIESGTDDDIKRIKFLNSQDTSMY